MDGRSFQLGDSGDHRHSAFHPHIRSHPQQLAAVPEAIFKNSLYKHAGSLGTAQGCQHRRLGIGGKPRIGRRAHGADGFQPLGTGHGDAVRPSMHLASRHPVHFQHRQQRPPVYPSQGRFSPSRRHGRQVGSCHDAVCDDGVFGIVQGTFSLDDHSGAARSRDARSGAAQERFQVHNLRLPGGVGDHRHAIGAAGRQHGILGGSYAGDRQDDLPSSKVVSTAVETAALTFYLSAHGGQCRQVQIDGSGA